MQKKNLTNNTSVNTFSEIIMRNMTRINAIELYAEALKNKLGEFWEEYIKKTGEDAPADCVGFHIATLNIITDDIIRLTQTAIDDLNSPAGTK